MLVGMSNQSTAARMVVALCGLWYVINIQCIQSLLCIEIHLLDRSLIFAVPMILKLHSRPGPPLPSGYSYFNIRYPTIPGLHMLLLIIICVH
jgi:hypothetical protein